MARINKTRNNINNQITSFRYKDTINTKLNYEYIESLVRRSIIKGYFDTVYFVKMIKRECKGFNNIFFCYNKKQQALKACFVYGNSKYNIHSFDILNLNICESSFINLILKNNNFKNVSLYETIKTPYIRKYRINENIIKTYIEHILSVIKFNKEWFFSLVTENFKRMKIKDIY